LHRYLHGDLDGVAPLSSNTAQNLGRDADHFPSSLNPAHGSSRETSNGKFARSVRGRVVELFFTMAVNVCAKRKTPRPNTFVLARPDQKLPSARLDNARLFTQPFLHLRERVPKITMSELFRLS